MQWLIDMIVGLAREQIGYFDRGDFPNFDFGVGDFTRDNVWRDLDLSAIVPENAQAVNFILFIRSSAINKSIQFRRKGHTGLGSIFIARTQVANIEIDSAGTLAVDSNRKIQYKVIDATFNMINLTIHGWWLR